MSTQVKSVMMFEDKIYTVEEIAVTLHTSEKYVYQILDRALRKIRKNKEICKMLEDYLKT